MFFEAVGLSSLALHLEVVFHLLYTLFSRQPGPTRFLFASSRTFLDLDRHVVQVICLPVVVIQQSGIFLLRDALGKHAGAELILSVVH